MMSFRGEWAGFTRLRKERFERHGLELDRLISEVLTAGVELPYQRRLSVLADRRAVWSANGGMAGIVRRTTDD